MMLSRGQSCIHLIPVRCEVQKNVPIKNKCILRIESSQEGQNDGVGGPITDHIKYSSKVATLIKFPGSHSIKGIKDPSKSTENDSVSRIIPIGEDRKNHKKVSQVADDIGDKQEHVLRFQHFCPIYTVIKICIIQINSFVIKLLFSSLIKTQFLIILAGQFLQYNFCIIINMLRLSNLLRNKVLLNKIPMRGGAPGWDRPDPPPSVSVPYDRQLTDEQIVYNFPDRSMPEYILTQPEVYEGDTLLQATPMLLKGFGLFLGVAATFSLIGFLMNPSMKTITPEPAELEMYRSRKELIQSRKMLKLANQNPLGIKLSNDSFPRGKVDQGSLEGSRLENIKIRYDENQKVIGEVRSYLLSVKEKATKKVHEKLAKQNAHHSEGHSEPSHPPTSQGHGEAPKEAPKEAHENKHH